MKLVKKIKLTISKTEKEKFDFWLRKCSYLYNVALQEKIWYYQATGKYLNKFEQKKQLVGIKKYDSSWKDVPNKSLCEVVFRVDKSFNSFFRGEGFPKFKNSYNFNSIEFVETDVRIKNSLIYLPKLKKGLKGTEKFPAKYKTVRLIKENNNYYLAFICDYEVEAKENKNTNVVGCDLGLKTLLTDSNGVKIKRFSTKLINRYNDRINKLNISLSKKKKGSKNRNKTKKQLSKTYSKLKNSCKDYLHKESIKYIKNVNEDILVIGKLEVRDLMKKDGSKKQKNISRSYAKSGITTFVNLLSYKATKYGKEVKIVGEEYTSKTCSCCSRVKYELKVTDREYNCTYCELNIDRDLNGAINIRKIYFDEFKPIGVNLTKIKNDSKLLSKNCLVQAI